MPRLLTHSKCETINVCRCLKQLSFGLLCYTVVEKLYAWVNHNVLRDKTICIISERALANYLYRIS